jgi:isopentenyl-diphosphate delta-isomerase
MTPPEDNTSASPLKNDPTAVQRKQDHIELALQSRVPGQEIDHRFYYEPLMAAHPKQLKTKQFLGKTMRAPIWISSMTGGTAMAGTINRNLAQVCAEFGLGMGLGSCRALLDSDEFFEDFNLRPIIGDSQPFYANLGIAQVEQLLAKGAGEKIQAMVHKLRADGLFIHVNPLQEWLQPEGDAITKPPIETIQQCLELGIKIIVKEVGQGMGPESLKALLQLPLAAIDFAAHGGTNFSRLELLRDSEQKQQVYGQLAHVGHTAEEMVDLVNGLIAILGDKAQVRECIISGGVGTYLDGYWLMHKLRCNSVYGQGSAFLKHAQGDYAALQEFVKYQVEGLKVAEAFLKVR